MILYLRKSCLVKIFEFFTMIYCILWITTIYCILWIKLCWKGGDGLGWCCSQYHCQPHGGNIGFSQYHNNTAVNQYHNKILHIMWELYQYQYLSDYHCHPHGGHNEMSININSNRYYFQPHGGNIEMSPRLKEWIGKVHEHIWWYIHWREAMHHCNGH